MLTPNQQNEWSSVILDAKGGLHDPLPDVMVDASLLLAVDAEWETLIDWHVKDGEKIEALLNECERLREVLRRVRAFLIDDEATHNNALLDCVQLTRELDGALEGHDAK